MGTLQMYGTTELTNLYKKMSKVGKTVLLSIIPHFCNRYIPRSVKGILPFLLTDIFDKDMLEATYMDLQLGVTRSIATRSTLTRSTCHEINLPRDQLATRSTCHEINSIF